MVKSRRVEGKEGVTDLTTETGRGTMTLEGTYFMENYHAIFVLFHFSP